MNHDWKIIISPNAELTNGAIRWNTDEYIFYQCNVCETFMIDPKFPTPIMIRRYCSFTKVLDEGATFCEISEPNCNEIIMQDILK